MPRLVARQNRRVTTAEGIHDDAVPGAKALVEAARDFLSALHAEFSAERAVILADRRQQQVAFDQGAAPDFDPETSDLRQADWQAAALPEALACRQVEITGPVDRKLIINALNSGADVFMADFEDSTAPTYANVFNGHLNIRDAVRGTIEYTHASTQKSYRLVDAPALLMVRPRGWHLSEDHFQVAREPMSASLFDVGMFLFHNAEHLHRTGRGPFVYLPKLEHAREAELWDRVLRFSEERLGLPRGTVRATVLIETIPAVFQMNEIIHALRDRCVGLNCGRWDYIFSYLKVFRKHAHRILPDRDQVTMQQPFMRAYSELLVETCHRRGIHAMGGMAADVPQRGDAAAFEQVIERVRADKEAELLRGHDGTWVAHPALVSVARDVFQRIGGPNQIHAARAPTGVDTDALLEHPAGTLTHAGLYKNASVGLRYTAAWLAGNGCVALDGKMEDAATAEISRAQLWQAAHYGAALDAEPDASPELVRTLIAQAAERHRTEYDATLLARAQQIFTDSVLADELAPFLPELLYPFITRQPPEKES